LAAREAIGLAPDGPPLYVVPGILKSAKRIADLVRAAKPLLAGGTIRLLLAGRVVDGAAADAARRAGAHVIDRPDDHLYERAIQAADVVVCVRARSVGESNGPLLDAIGAGKAVLASKIGSIPEVAGKAAWYVPADACVSELRSALQALAMPDLRLRRASAAAERAEELSWDAAATAHRELFEQVAAPARPSAAGVAVAS
jgi:glycosyltransferase involved in cell wall biosynthesis